MAGYSGTPLPQKLGIKTGAAVFLKGAPPGYRTLLAPLPANVRFPRRLAGRVDLIHVFVKESKKLAAELPKLMGHISAGGAIWVSWPKKAAKAPTDVTENVIRDIALPLGLVDVKVCAVDEVWSGLKLVIRKDRREP